MASISGMPPPRLQIRKLNDENLALYGTALNIDMNNAMYIRKCWENKINGPSYL